MPSVNRHCPCWGEGGACCYCRTSEDITEDCPADHSVRRCPEETASKPCIYRDGRWTVKSWRTTPTMLTYLAYQHAKALNAMEKLT